MLPLRKVSFAWALLLCFWCGCIKLSPASAQVFDNPSRLPAADAPSIVLVADLNGDGIPDILYGNMAASPEEIDVYLGQGGRRYVRGTSVQLPRKAGVIFCRTADANRDGHPDLICLNLLDNYDFNVLTYLGNGDGTFQPAIASQAFSDPVGIYLMWLSAPVDFNGDHIPDLAVGIYDGRGLAGSIVDFLLGDGKGNFTLKSTQEFFSGPAVWDFTAADVNGDGKVDLLGGQGPWVFLGNGDGTFQPGQGQATFDHCTFHDMNGDGRVDAACGAMLNTQGQTGGGDASGASELAILYSRPDGSFNATPAYKKVFGDPIGGRAKFMFPQFVGDVNHDGFPDVLGYSEDGLSVVMGQSDGSFSDPVAHYSVGFVGASWSMSTVYADMDGDSITDIVSSGPNGVYISYGRADGTFAAPRAFEPGRDFNYPTVADFDGDGIPDILASDGGHFSLNRGKGDGSFQPYVSVDTGAVTILSFALEHGDFLGRGIQDVLTFGHSGSSLGFYLMEGHGDGTFAAPQFLASPTTPPTLTTPISVVDINHDGRDDFLFTGNDWNTSEGGQSITAAISNGDGTFNVKNTVVPGNNTNPGATGLAFADFNGDGKTDAAYGVDNTIFVVPGLGDGTFGAASAALPAPVVRGRVPLAILSIAAGDFDGDGRPDIAAVIQIDNAYSITNGVVNAGPPFQTAVVVYYGEGDSRFSDATVVATLMEPYNAIYAPDVNHDGRPHLLLVGTAGTMSFASAGGSSLCLLPNLGNRFFGPEQVYTDGIGGRTPMSIADLNGDHYPDLVAYGAGITPLLNRGPEPPDVRLPTSTLLNSSLSSVSAGTAVTFNATVSSAAAGQPVPSGTVQFVDQTGVSSVVSLTPASATTAVATFTTNALGIGSDTVAAFYSGDSVFAPSSARTAEVVTGIATTVTIAPWSAPAMISSSLNIDVAVANVGNATAPAPQGEIVLTDGGYPVGRSAEILSQRVEFNEDFIVPGVHHLAARYSGDSIHQAATGAFDLVVLATPSVDVTASQYQFLVTDGTTVNITVRDSRGPTPTGSVTLAGGGYKSASVGIVNGSAVFKIPAGTFAVGSYTLTCTYTPDSASTSTYTTASGSQLINVLPIPPSFSLSGTPVTLTAGATAGNTSTISVTPANGFTGGVTLTAAFTTMPDAVVLKPVLSFADNPVNISGTNPASTTMLIATRATQTAALRMPLFDFLNGKPGSAALVCILMILLPGRKQRWRRWLGCFLLTVALMCGVSSCGGGGGSVPTGGTVPGTTLGTYVVTITGVSGQLTATTTVTIIVR